MKHRDAFDAYVTQVFSIKENCPTIGVKFKPESREHVVYVSAFPDSMRETISCLGVMLGDIAHNLRSALDHLAYQLALKNLGGSFPSAESERRVQFPIEDKEPTFKRRCTSPNSRGWIADLHPDDQAIIERFQVYNGADDLGFLRDLSNDDKHRLLAPVMFAPTTMLNSDVAAGYIIRKNIEHSLRLYGEIRTSTVELGAVLFRARLPEWDGDEFEVDMAGYIAPSISFAGNYPVIKTVDRIGARVIKVLREFDPLAEFP